MQPTSHHRLQSEYGPMWALPGKALQHLICPMPPAASSAHQDGTTCIKLCTQRKKTYLQVTDDGHSGEKSSSKHVPWLLFLTTSNPQFTDFKVSAIHSIRLSAIYFMTVNVTFRRCLLTNPSSSVNVFFTVWFFTWAKPCFIPHNLHILPFLLYQIWKSCK